VQNVRTTHFNFFFTTFFIRSSAHRIVSSRLATTARTKVTVEKTPNRAGATPLFGGQSAQKFVGSLPPFTQDRLQQAYGRGLDSAGGRSRRWGMSREDSLEL
jgi:hypothetical protein